MNDNNLFYNENRIYQSTHVVTRNNTRSRFKESLTAIPQKIAKLLFQTSPFWGCLRHWAMNQAPPPRRRGNT